MPKATINPVTGRKIREFTYVLQVEDLKTGELTHVIYIFVTDKTVPPTIWNNRSDCFNNARPEFVKDFLENGEQWYDFSQFAGRMDTVKKMDEPTGDAPEGYKLHDDYRLDVNFVPGEYYDGSGVAHPFQWQVQRYSQPNNRFICVEHGTADDFDTAIQLGKSAFEALKI